MKIGGLIAIFRLITTILSFINRKRFEQHLKTYTASVKIKSKVVVDNTINNSINENT